MRLNLTEMMVMQIRASLFFTMDKWLRMDDYESYCRVMEVEMERRVENGVETVWFHRRS